MLLLSQIRIFSRLFLSIGAVFFSYLSVLCVFYFFILRFFLNLFMGFEPASENKERNK